MVIYQSTVTPACAPYYEADVDDQANRTDYTLIRRGPPLSEALRPNSPFLKRLDQLDPQRQYVFVYVDASSFATFCAIREELRKRELQWGWQPRAYGDFWFGTGQGGDPVGPQGRHP